MKEIKFVFFGTSRFSIFVLQALKAKGFLPSLVVTFPDKPEGRNLALTPNPAKVWAIENRARILEITSFRDESVVEALEKEEADVFIVASFGKILPDKIIYMPPYKTLNVHPSLLPKLRGPSPLQGAILTEDTTGVTIMRLNEKMDEGPIIAKKEIEITPWPPKYSALEETLGIAGGNLLAEILPSWINGEIREVEQDHDSATYTHKISKQDGDISRDSAEIALRKINAFEIWPRAFTYHEKKNGQKERLIVEAAHIEDGRLVLDLVRPEGRKTVSWADYIRGN